MKIRCIDHEGYVSGNRLDLTVGKVYEVLSQNEILYKIIDDKGDIYDYLKDRFEVVEG
ncbi:MAG: DUF6501 family protein [Sarcina sp.]